MGKIVTPNQPCPIAPCTSSDGYQIYEDGSGHCFVCRKGTRKGESTELRPRKKRSLLTNYEKEVTIEEINALPVRGFRDRKISKRVVEFYGCKISYGSDGNIKTHYYYYSDKAYKVRELPKTFYMIGVTKLLFGQKKFNPGGKRLIITEGEIDAMAVQQANIDRWDRFFPVVSLRSSAQVKDLIELRDYARSFKEVVLLFDQDEAGEKATQEAVSIIGYDKVKVGTMPFKDASDLYINEGTDGVQRAIFDAVSQTPVGMVSDKEAVLDALRTHRSVESIPYPPCLEGLNTKIKGMRFHQIATFVSGTGSGKSTVIKEIMLHILETTPHKIGTVLLEESVAETSIILAGMMLNKNPAKYDLGMDELEKGVNEFFKYDEEGNSRVIILDHQGAINNFSMYDRLEYMCLSGCKFLFVDHITILVSEGADGKEGLEAQDKIMNDLLRLTKKYPVWIGLVSHLRKVQSGKRSFEQGVLPTLDDIRGSGSIKQISFDVIGFARNMSADAPSERNMIKMASLKSRHSGLTGKVEGTFYNYDTGRLIREEDIDFMSLDEYGGVTLDVEPKLLEEKLLEIQNDEEFNNPY